MAQIPFTPASLEEVPTAFAALAEARRTTPVLHDEATNTWHLFRYEDVDRVLLDYAGFSSEEPARPGAPPIPDEFSLSIIGMDPPRHRQLRALVSQAFTPKAIIALRPRIEALANDLINQARAAGDGRMDLIRDFAEPLPVTVIAEMLGVPVERRRDFKRWSDDVVSGDPARQEVGMTEMAEFFRTMIAARRQAATDDLIDDLVKAQIDGAHLAEAEIVAFSILLLVAGNATTTNLIGNAIVCLDAHPEQFARVRETPPSSPARSRRPCAGCPPSGNSAASPRKAPRSPASTSRPARRSSPGWPPPTATPSASPTPMPSTHNGRRTSTSPSAVASTPASAPRCRGSRRRSRCRCCWSASPICAWCATHRSRSSTATWFSARRRCRSSSPRPSRPTGPDR
jgi:hypothetical protein